MDPRADRLLSYNFLLGLVALGSWIAYVRTDQPRLWLAVAVVSTVACAATRLQATLVELGAQLLPQRSDDPA